MVNQNLRITENVSIMEMVTTLSGGNADSMEVLFKWLERDPLAVMAFLTSIDMKHFYDEHIFIVYELVCGEDIDRFIYHVQMELPDQETGNLMVSGPYSSQVNIDEFYSKRRAGKPGHYWALENPPKDPYYEYPIR